jgi:uncharacterized protein
VSPRVTYLDASALVKLVVAEAETDALVGWVAGRERLASCALVRTEVPRAIRLLGPDALAGAREVIKGLDLIAIDDRLLETAALLDPQILRSLDAIHLAAAGSLGLDLDVIVSYDQRMLDGARMLGLPTSRPT